MDIREYDVRVRNGFSWHRMESRGWILWTR